MFELINGYEKHQAHRDEIRRDVQRQTLADDIRRQQGHQPFYASVLAGVGDVLVEVGSKLQDRYGCLGDDVHPAPEVY
jgi:hypothetical protein